MKTEANKGTEFYVLHIFQNLPVKFIKIIGENLRICPHIHLQKLEKLGRRINRNNLSPERGI